MEDRVAVPRQPGLLWDRREHHLHGPEDLDTSLIDGFAINAKSRLFAYDEPGTVNGGEENEFTFHFAFDTRVEARTQITIEFPIGYKLELDGSNICNNYLVSRIIVLFSNFQFNIGFDQSNSLIFYIIFNNFNFVGWFQAHDGKLPRTTPRCGANKITWYLEHDFIAERDEISFSVTSEHPKTTPEPRLQTNIFKLTESLCLDSDSRCVDRVIKSSHVVQGFHIIPQLKDPQVKFIAPLTEATYSFATVRVSAEAEMAANRLHITARVTEPSVLRLPDDFVAGDAVYDFSAASIVTDKCDALELAPEHPNCQSLVGRIARQNPREVLINIDIRAKEVVEVILKDVRHPRVPGVTAWDFTTYFAKDLEDSSIEGIGKRTDQIKEVRGPDVLGFLEILSSSNVDPSFYASENAKLSINFQGELSILADSIIEIHAAPGFTFVDKTFSPVQFGNIQSNWDGIIRDGDATIYQFHVATTIDAGKEARFQIGVNLPHVRQQSGNWKITSLAPRERQEVNAAGSWETVEYYQATNTNDNKFEGFFLVARIDFSVVPTQRSPGMLTALQLTFNVEEPQEAKSKITLRLTAPFGFKFESQCFGGAGGGNAFRKCDGSAFTATLITQNNVLAGVITVTLLVSNPESAPPSNEWKLSLIKDDDQQDSSLSSFTGYSVEEMDVEMYTTNKLGHEAHAFFVFSPGATIHPYSTITVVPPEHNDYIFTCLDQRVGLPQMPQCTEEIGKPLILDIRNSSLLGGEYYTFGVVLQNPNFANPHSVESNQFGIRIRDVNGDITDANMEMAGPHLSHFPAMNMRFLWSSVNADEASNLKFHLRVTEDLSVGAVTEVTITGPEGIMYDAPDSVTIRPDEFPLVKNRPYVVGSSPVESRTGETLTIHIDHRQAVLAGNYEITFSVRNPTKFRHDNFWTLRMIKNIYDVRWVLRI